jgi:hypothetical protein
VQGCVAIQIPAMGVRQHTQIYLHENGKHNFLNHKYEGCVFKCFLISNPKQGFKNYAYPDSLLETLLANYDKWNNSLSIQWKIAFIRKGYHGQHRYLLAGHIFETEKFST